MASNHRLRRAWQDSWFEAESHESLIDDLRLPQFNHIERGFCCTAHGMERKGPVNMLIEKRLRVFRWRRYGLGTGNC